MCVWEKKTKLMKSVMFMEPEKLLIDVLVFDSAIIVTDRRVNERRRDAAVPSTVLKRASQELRVQFLSGSYESIVALNAGVYISMQVESYTSLFITFKLF